MSERSWTRDKIAEYALKMLTISNVAARRAQTQNRAMSIPNYYSIPGRIVPDADTKTALTDVTATVVRG